MYTTENKKAKLRIAELNGEMVEFTTHDGSMLVMPVTKLHNWIENQGLLIESVFVGNRSPYGDCDPAYDEYKDMEILTAEEYLDENFKSVTSAYFNDIVEGKEL